MRSFRHSRMRRCFAARPSAAVALTLLFGWSLGAGSLLHTHAGEDDAAAIGHPSATPAQPSLGNGPSRPAEGECLACELACISRHGVASPPAGRPDARPSVARPQASTPRSRRIAAGAVRLRAPPLHAS